MKLSSHYSIAQVIGHLWRPMDPICAMEYKPDPYDAENMRGETGQITRESVRRWLDTHAGDFSSIIDFRASIVDGDDTVEIDWAQETSEWQYYDTMYGDVVW